ncbi:hypothetical protein [Nocardioides sp. YIM 152588]|uniref:hypothetical protein n=1 Tax=Nocardioides sp. YIM 152588 TaxID=3158259 RepID=UPI0032E46283
MARRVFVHVGLPKTGTSYLQSVFWPQRDRLRELGLLVPGRERRDHLLSSLIVREDDNVHRRGPGAAEAWQVVTAETAAHPGTALISHEFFCSASTEQFRRMVADLAPAEVHVVITAREPLGLFTSSWQESLKNRATAPLADYSRRESDDPRVTWNWRALDLGLVLERLRPVLPDERVHVIVSPGPGDPRDELWRRFATVIGIDPDAVDVADAFPNASMGVVEAELLRRVNAHLGSFQTAQERARWIRTVLADRLLVTPDAERFWPGEDRVEDARRRGDRAADLLAAGGYDVLGDPARLRVPAELPPRRRPDEVTEAELLEASVRLNAQLLGELRGRARSEAPGTPTADDADASRRTAGLRSRLRALAGGRRPGRA